MSEALADDIKELDVEYSRYRNSERVNIVGARIEDVYSINITSLNILEQEGKTFTCEPEIEAEIGVDLDVEVEGRYGEYEPSHLYSKSHAHTEYIYPEVVVHFDQSTGSLEFESISLVGRAIQISIDDVDWRRPF